MFFESIGADLSQISIFNMIKKFRNIFKELSARGTEKTTKTEGSLYNLFIGNNFKWYITDIDYFTYFKMLKN